jgi:hypothetical protein
MTVTVAVPAAVTVVAVPRVAAPGVPGATAVIAEAVPVDLVPVVAVPTTAVAEIAARTTIPTIVPLEALPVAEGMAPAGLALIHREFGNGSSRRRFVIRLRQCGPYERSMTNPSAG